MSKTTEPTPEQISQWKEQFGKVYKIESLGKVGYLKDPLSSLAIMKQAYTAIKGGDIAYTVSILNNCWLAGDEELKTEEKYGNGLVDQIDDIADLVKFKVERKDNCYVAFVEDHTLRMKVASRHDIMDAEQRNAAGEPFETNINLLNSVCLDKEKLREIKKNDRIYIGFIRAVGKVKDKAYVSVKEL